MRVSVSYSHYDVAHYFPQGLIMRTPVSMLRGVTRAWGMLSTGLSTLAFAHDPGEHYWDDEHLFGETDYVLARAIIERANKSIAAA